MKGRFQSTAPDTPLPPGLKQEGLLWPALSLDLLLLFHGQAALARISG